METATEPLLANRPRIVLADDQPELRSALATRLRMRGYEVVEAGDGAELLEILDNATPDLVICDLQMPQFSGLEVLAKLRQSDWTIPFILMTGYASPQTHAVARKMGAAYVFQKPLDFPHLVAAARSIVGG